MAAGNSKRAVCVIAALLCLAAVLAGCMQGDREKEEKKLTTLDWYVNFSWFTAQWGENHVTRAITDATGVQVRFSVPAGDEGETLNAMLQQDKLPDLITVGWWAPQVSTLIEEGYVYPLNELAEQYAPEFLENAGAAQLEWYRQPDGNVYGCPSFSVEPGKEVEGSASSNVVFVVRKDLYEALGCPDMTTPEGFADALRRAAEQFPQVDGMPLIPLGVGDFNEYGNASLSDSLRDFLAIPQEKNGVAYDYVTDPDYLTWLKTLRQLVADGIIKSDFFLDKRQQTLEKIRQGRYFCLIYQWSDMEAELKTIYEQDPERMYIAVDGPKNSSGDNHTLSEVGMNGWTLTFISRDCEDPEKAIQLMSYLLSEEGSELVRYGVEGLDYQMQAGQPQLIGQAAELFQKDYSSYIQQIGANNTYWMLQDMGASLPVTALDQIREWSAQYTVNVSAYEVAFAPGSKAAAADEQIKQLWGQTLPDLLLAPTEQEFDQVFQDYLTRRKEMGWDALMQARTNAFLQNHGKLARLEYLDEVDDGQ